MLSAVIEETESLRNFLFGSAPGCEYDNWMSHITEGVASPGYNKYAPWDRQLTGFGNYVIPGEDTLNTWNVIIDQFLAGNLDTAQDTIDANNFPYQVVIFHDIETGHTLHLLREIPNMEYYDDNETDDPGDDELGAFDFGWGLYIHYPDGPYPHITTAPHPCDDYVTIPLAYQAFVEQESKFLLISAVGREVVWNNSGSYTNSKSLSDPTRNPVHIYNLVYQNCCDLIREEFQTLEFSLQVHSYDWGDSHAGYANVQISGGYQVSSPDLPIRDHSSFGLDMANFSPECILSANTVGLHDAVCLNDYYAFHCKEYDFNYSNSDTTFAVNTSTDLWGYSGNCQFNYTQNGMNTYDVFEPCFHVEVDELPNCYPQTVSNYNWFNGWDPVTQTWDMARRFDYALQYYAPMIHTLTELLPYVYEMNDGTIPVAPSDLHVIENNSGYVKIGWEPGDSFDLDSYEILYSNQPISQGNFQIYDRSNNSRLACLATHITSINYSSSDSLHLAIRLRDKNYLYSDISNEIVVAPTAVTSDNLAAYGRDQSIILEWSAYSDNDFSGFNVYRKTAFSAYELIDTWLTNPSLTGQTGIALDYQYLDQTTENNLLYTYQLQVVQNGVESLFGEPLAAESRPIFQLYAVNSLAVSDTCWFGFNTFASDGYEADFDLAADTTAVSEYFLTEFYEQYWNDVPKNLEQEIKYFYDTENALKSWTYRLRTDFLNTEVEIGLANPDRNAERIYLYRSGQYIDLTSSTYNFTPTSTDYYTFTLYYGNLTPNLEFAEMANQLLYPSEQITLDWTVDRQVTIAYINLYAENDDISIPLATDLLPSTTQFAWTVPNLLFEDLQIRIDLEMQQGDTLSYYSPYKFGIISPQMTVQTAEGWHLFTQNFTSNLYTFEQIYGQNVQFLEWQNEFVNVTEPEYLHPYWLYAPQSHYAALSSVEMQRTASGFSLAQGWNIIPNPHRATYRIDQLKFTLNGQSFEYYQAVQNHLIEPAAFAFDTGFELTDWLYADAAYYLYCYEDGIDLSFIPYYSNLYSPQFEYDWRLDLQAEQSGQSAQILVGTSELADSLFNPTRDILKPEILPYDDAISFYLPLEDQKLHQSITNQQNTTDFYYDWAAELRLPSLESMTFSTADFILPENYFVYLQMPDVLLPILPGQPSEYLPADSLLSCTVIVCSEPLLSTGHELVAAELSLMNFPNPFNPETTIRFNLPEAGKVTLNIYNIKGQKVRELINDKIAAGQHSVVWNGKDEGGKQAASGVYFYRLKAAGHPSIIHKMLMLK